MPEYIVLMKLTDRGAREMESAPGRQAQARRVFEEKLDGKFEGFWLTMGEYDYVAIGSVPTDEKALSFAMYLAMEGNVRTVTLPAFAMGTVEAALKLVVPYHHAPTGEPESE